MTPLFRHHLISILFAHVTFLKRMKWFMSVFLEMQTCDLFEFTNLCAFSFQIILPRIWIGIVVKVIADQILFGVT